jgi:uncharacterized membrane protein
VSRGRLEAFSDAVLAVVITIMVLNLRPPAGDSLTDLRPLLPKLAVYLLSFVFVAIYWNNHHHMFQVVSRISGGVLWANAHLLFWLSLTPAAAAWLGPHLGDTAPTAVYGVVLLGSAIAYTILTRSLLAGATSGFSARSRNWPRHEGEALDRRLRSRDRGLARRSLVLAQHLLRSGRSLARP